MIVGVCENGSAKITPEYDKNWQKSYKMKKIEYDDVSEPSVVTSATKFKKKLVIT